MTTIPSKSCKSRTAAPRRRVGCALKNSMSSAIAHSRLPTQGAIHRASRLFFSRGTLAGHDGSPLSAIVPIYFEERAMIFKLVSAAAIAALMFTAAPASAMKMASCNQKNMDKADAMLMKMPDGENKTMGMQEMTSAKSSMSQKDMAGCQDHMNKAMKMGMMKSKKM